MLPATSNTPGLCFAYQLPLPLPVRSLWALRCAVFFAPRIVLLGRARGVKSQGLCDFVESLPNTVCFSYPCPEARKRRHAPTVCGASLGCPKLAHLHTLR